MQEDGGVLECAMHFHNQEESINVEMAEETSFYERTLVTYFSGYVLHHIMKKYDCIECPNKNSDGLY
jgi:hypothetical protein